MSLWLAMVLFLLAMIGIVLSCKYIPNTPTRTLCVIFFGLLVLSCAIYIGLAFLFVDAVQNQPPSL